MKRITAIVITAAWGLVSNVLLLPVPEGQRSRNPQRLGNDPLNAAYTIEGREIQLRDGLSEMEPAPGSTTKIKTLVFGRPAIGDLNGDGEDDAALILVHDPGGSGVFYYVAAALQHAGQFQGTNAVLIGDRIAPHDLWISHEMVTVNYLDRRPGDPMSAPPLIDRSRQHIIEGGRLKLIEGQHEGQVALPGWIIISHDMRSFKPCSFAAPLWLTDTSPASDEITAAYSQERPQSAAPLFAILAGKVVQRPDNALDGAHKSAFVATHLVRVFPRGNCQSDLILVDAPAPGDSITSPVRISGRARGKWFFEGDFPVVLKDQAGRLIASGFCSAKGEWMTESLVPFEGTLEFKEPHSGQNGTLVLKRNNPSDLRQGDDALEIAVNFK